MPNLVCSNYEVITVSTAIKTLTAAKVTPTTGRFANQMCDTVILTLETDVIRYSLYTGTTVSSTVGIPMGVADSLELSNGAFRDLTCIKSGTADAKLHVSYFHAV